MPRVKIGHVARATCAVAVICLYLLYEYPWSAGTSALREKHEQEVWHAGGGGADVLKNVNMFIGTINGGELMRRHEIGYTV